ncbi:MAG: transposase [Verrucomicrobiota bacterium]|nr:transposase [Verrucomicrobiota bacterium]
MPAIRLGRLAMLDRLDLGDEGLRPVVILDAGFASEENIKLLEERGCFYIVNITRGSRTRYAEHFENETFSPLPGRKVDKQVEVKRIADPETKTAAPCSSGAPSAGKRNRR